MDRNIREASSIHSIISRMKLLPLIDSCESVWPTKIDIQLILPNYEKDFRCLKNALENNSSQFIQESNNPEILNAQASFISCCYESTAFLISEELDAEQQSLRERYIWNQLMQFSNRKSLMFLLFKQYKKTLLEDEWYYHFGSLTSFCGFVWDLLDFDSYSKLIDRNAVELIEQVSFLMMKSKSVKLFVKGVTILEECIHKTRGHALVDYEATFKELSQHTWRLTSKDERNQRGSIIMLSAMWECVRVLEVERNQLKTLIENFRYPCRADSLMNIILRGIKASRSVSGSILLMESLLKLLTVDHEGIQVISEHLLSDVPSGATDRNSSISSIVVMKNVDKLNIETTDWWKEIIANNTGRFHRWTEKILKLLITEIDKFEKIDAIYFQLISCALFFLMYTNRSETAEQMKIKFQLMAILVKKMVSYINPDQLAAVKEKSYLSVLKNCELLVEANVACFQYYATRVPEVLSNEIDKQLETATRR